MFSASAEYYDLIYSAIRDYPGDVAALGARLRRHHPPCASVLDVACGTGEHARLLAAAGFQVDGVDLNPAFVGIARQKHPTGQFEVRDMSAFDLGRRYDAVLCLFSSIGYLCTLDRVRQALVTFRNHLAPGGAILVEPWFTPGALVETTVATTVAERAGVRVTRTGRITIDGAISRIQFDYDVEDGGGVRQFREWHELGLFTTDELLEAFRHAGLAAQHDPVGLAGRGLFVATTAETDLASGR